MRCSPDHSGCTAQKPKYTRAPLVFRPDSDIMCYMKLAATLVDSENVRSPTSTPAAAEATFKASPTCANLPSTGLIAPSQDAVPHVWQMCKESEMRASS